MFEYRSDPFGNILDFLFGNTYTLLNKLKLCTYTETI